MLQIRSFCLWSVLTLLGATLCSNAQIRANGFIDNTFKQPTCLANASVNFVTRAVLVEADGRIIVGGQFSTPSACANGMVRLQTSGDRDNTFGSQLSPTDFVTSIATQSTGKVIIGGQLTASGPSFPVTRLNANGGLDASFTRLLGQQLIANALVVQGDDKVIAVGTSGGLGFIYRFMPDGTTDGAFANGIVTGATDNNQGISAVAIHLSKIVVGGSFRLFGLESRDGLAWLSATGDLDPLLHAPITNANVQALLVQPDGKLLVAGKFTTVAGPNICLTRLTVFGTRDSSFNDVNGLGITAFALALQPDGKILVGHSLGVMRLTSGGDLDTSFGPLNAPGSFGTEATLVTALARTAEGDVMVGATRVFDTASTRRGVARLFGNLPPAPVITQQPVNQTVDAGTNVTFSIIATGAPPITFQWRKNAVSIKNETNSSLVLVDVDSTDAANYTVIASNSGGSRTSVVARLSVTFQTAPLTLITNGAGMILPKLPAELEIGREFMITAKPLSGNIFSNWSGGVTSSSPFLTFTMQTNLVIVANFVPSPFIPAVGVYNGIFYDTNAPAHGNAGAFTATLDANGVLKGSLRISTHAGKFTTTFSAERTTSTNVAVTAIGTSVTLTLEVDTANAIIRGAVSFRAIGGILIPTSDTNVSTLVAYRNPFSSKLNPAPTAGLFNAALPGRDDSTTSRFGDGFVALTVSTAGRVSGKGTLPDGTALKILSATSANAQVPVYAPLYSGRGSIFGWLTVTNSDLNDVAGTLWASLGPVGGGIYTVPGASNQIDVMGSHYVAPAAGTPAITLTNGVAILSHGNLVEPLTNSITLGGDNKIVGDNQLTIAISPAKGSVKGTFVDPSSGAKRALKGIALPKQNQLRGFFLGDDETGRLFVGEAP
jgi:uncharacterized delta-60 repeat protein